MTLLNAQKALLLLAASLIGGVGITLLDGSFVRSRGLDADAAFILWSLSYAMALGYISIGAFLTSQKYKKVSNDISIKLLLTYGCMAGLFFGLPTFLVEPVCTIRWI